jgi:hypothetical protein
MHRDGSWEVWPPPRWEKKSIAIPFGYPSIENAVNHKR